MDFGGGRVQTVHSGILSCPSRQPEPDFHNLNQRFIRAAALGDLTTVESILGGGGPAMRVADDQEFVPLPDRYVNCWKFFLNLKIRKNYAGMSFMLSISNSISTLIGLHKAAGNGFTNVVISILKFR